MLSNLGNSKPGTVDAIKAAERIHWALGLKQAENTLFALRSTFQSNLYSQRKVARDIELKREKIRYLKIVSILSRFIPVLGLTIRNKVENLKDEIESWIDSKEDRESLVRDCAYEISIARTELNRILIEHPEAVTLNYEELQEEMMTALKEKKLKYIIPRYWAAKNNLPESVGVTLFDCSEEERNYLITRVAQELYGSPVSEEVIRVAGVISRLPSYEQQSLLNSLNHE